jgi:hypothetical protein
MLLSVLVAGLKPVSARRTDSSTGLNTFCSTLSFFYLQRLRDVLILVELAQKAFTPEM